MEKVKQDPTFSFVDVDLKFNKPELNIEINRQKARDLGVSVLDIAQTLQLGLSGQRFGYFIMNGKQYQVIGQIQREGGTNPLMCAPFTCAMMLAIWYSWITSSPWKSKPLHRRCSASTALLLLLYPLDWRATIPGQRYRSHEPHRSGNTGRWLLHYPDRYLPRFCGKLLQPCICFYAGTGTHLLVLAAQFESFIDPLIIMFTVPLALAGAVLSLMLYEQTLNIFSQIGIIMLIGLVDKNGILIVEFANQRKEAGLSRLEAIKEAAEARFRPILMTSLSTILGVLPIALALGAGSESRVSMGIAVIGGLVFSTVLTLYVIPDIYSYLSSKEAKRTKREEQLKALEEV